MNKNNVIAYVCSGVAILAAVILIFVFVGFSGSANKAPDPKSTAAPVSVSSSAPAGSAAPAPAGVSTVVTPAMSGTDYEGKAITFPSLSIDYPQGWTVVENTFSTEPFSGGKSAELVFQNGDGLQLSIYLELGFDGYGLIAGPNSWEMLTDTGMEGLYLVSLNSGSNAEKHKLYLVTIPNYDKEKGGANYSVGPGMIDDGSRQNKVLGAAIRRPALNGDSKSISLEEANVSNEELAQIESIVASLRMS